MRQQYRLDVVLTLLGPILTRGASTAAPGIDAPLARDGRGRSMLPFSLVKGKLLDAFRDLRPPDDAEVADWFGKASSTESFDPERGRLRFTDFASDDPGDPDGLIERVKIDGESGSVEPRMLAVVEAPYGYGKAVEFRGAVEFAASPDGEQLAIAAALNRAFRWVPAYGALRTVGFGRTQSVTTALAECPRQASGTPAAGPSLPLRLRFDRPLCVVGRKHSGNHFASLQSVPGAVLKGAVARLVLELSGSSARVLDPARPCPRWPALTRHFAHIRFAEARPMDEQAEHRPVVPPLSLVTSPTQKDAFFDVALEPGAALIGGAAPVFAIDWKDRDHALLDAAFGQQHLPRERRIRTAIEVETGRALDKNLFSYELVLPESHRADGSIASFVWETAIGLEHDEIPVADRPAIAAELADLLAHGLPAVGKTRATAAVEWRDRLTPAPATAVEVAPPGGEHVVTLQTAFLMTDPTVLMRGSDGGLEQAYREFWHEISDKALELVRFFARQELHGGFLAMRSRPGRYEPFLATTPGSVFVLRTVDADRAEAALKRWRSRGLDVPAWVAARYGVEGVPLWNGCPFLPHAGFGEVAVDLACHTENRPEAGGSSR